MALDAAMAEQAPLATHETPSPTRPRSLLRFLTCGSVDDGKSTLIGRLLYDSAAIPTDQLAALARDSRRFGTVSDGLDFALLLDGLAAEREQGITIDVAYRYFSTSRRAFIVADTPGHEQYTRNMATGASTADLAVILVDARKGILAQTRRHSFIAAMLRVRHVVLAVNKMDLVGFDAARFDAIVAAYQSLATTLDFASVVAVPLCAREGDNIARRSGRMPWYEGPTLLHHLETVEAEPPGVSSVSFRMPVQWVNRPDHHFRGFAGTIASGEVRRDDAVAVLPGRTRSRIARIVTANGDIDQAIAGQAVTLTLADELDVARGDVMVAASDDIVPQRRFAARLLCMTEDGLRPGAEYLLQLGTATAGARVETLRHAVDIDSFAPRPSAGLSVNEIGLADLKLDRAIVATRYAEDRELGGFILIDRMTNQTAAIGFVQDVFDPAPSGGSPPRRAQDRHWRSLAKAATWRATGSLDTFLISWWLTGQPSLAGGIAGVEIFTKISLFYLHERAWGWVPWGRRARPAAAD
ncbi:MAG TPA: sulfate adenylyltransferase subunit CysN [Acetobacteraceae bacterium]|nr:sulfate adenylyltransferase subunit CysN [Acetobacteraceae bacterium]